jgi:hypothetical protein
MRRDFALRYGGTLRGMKVSLAARAATLTAAAIVAACTAIATVAGPFSRPAFAEGVARAAGTATSTPSPRQKSAAYPRFRKGTSYKAARQKLLALGWTPVPPTGESPCEPGDDSCREMPELQSCAGTGEGNCLFLWRRDKTVIAIFSYDDPPLIKGSECRSGCR